MIFLSKEERTRDFLDLCTRNKFELKDDFYSWLDNGGFFTAPASTKYHGAYEGGLYDHSRTVYSRLEELTQNNHLNWLRPQSPFIIGMFHDLCKTDQYILVYEETREVEGNMITINPNGKSHYEYNPSTILKGHAPKSIMLLSQFVPLTEEEMLSIRFHMGAYETDDWDGFDKAIHKYPNVLWTHQADQLASKVDSI